MRLHFGAVLPILLGVAATANPGSYSGSGSTGGNVGTDAGVVYLPAESLQHELLNTTGLVPDSLVAVTASYEALKGESPGLAGVTAPNTTVYASVLIVPAKGSVGTTTTASGAHEAASAAELSGRTQLTYNCTSAANLWNLQEDPSVVKLASFQQFSSTDNSTSSNTTREIVAIASIEVSNCAIVQKSAVGRPVLGDAFFNVDFSSDPAYFYTMNASGADISASGGCLLRLELARANFSEVYPRCKIAFQSTDLDNLMHSNASATSGEANKTRRLELGAFGFVEDPYCVYGCGEQGAAPDECVVGLVDGEATTTSCQLQFYEQNPECDNECGDKVGDLDFLPASQCYQCEYDWFGDCDDGLSRAGWDTCCVALYCEPVLDSTVTSPKGLTWNLLSDGETISEPSYVIYEDGDCSDPTDFSSNCCRITCENCFVSISVVSLYADIDTYGLSDYSTSSEIKLSGNSYLRVKVFAPNGCDIQDVETTIDETATIPLYSGIDVEVEVQLDILRRLSLQPHGTSVEFGASTDIQGVTAGYLNSEPFVDVQLTSTPVRDLEQSGIDIELEVAAIPTVRASISLLSGIAKIGVKTSYAISAELKASVKFPEPFSALPTEYLDPESYFHYGDCSLPHFMEFAGYAGFKDVTVSIPMSLEIPLVVDKTYEPSANAGSLVKSLFSGCIATAYDAEMLLSTAINAVSSLSEDKRRKLKKIVMWLLGISEIDSDFLSIDSVSSSTGEISIRIAVPPAVADVYPEASGLQAVLYERARTASFSNAISNYVGLDVNAQCDSGSWGPTCDYSCDLGHCMKAKCNPVDGVTISCSYCESGYWGPTCQERCELPTHCASAWCPQYSGAVSECWSCEESWEGDLCETISTPDSSSSGDTSSSTSSGSTDSTPTPTNSANTGAQTSSACTWAVKGPLLWFQVFTSVSGLIWLL